jgi:hypothetical protein
MSGSCKFWRVGDVESANEAWKISEKAYAGTNTNNVRLQTHERQYELLQMKEKEGIVGAFLVSMFANFGLDFRVHVFLWLIFRFNCILTLAHSPAHNLGSVD